jgi:hypothetical protein
MGQERHVGRASVRRHLGRARVGHAVGTAATPERAPTDVLKAGDEAPPPVFVDGSGQRRRRLRWVAYGTGLVVLLVLLLFWLSQLGGPVRPEPSVSCPATSTRGAAVDDCLPKQP